MKWCRANAESASENELAIVSAVSPGAPEGFHRLYFEAGLDALTVQLNIPSNFARRAFKAFAAMLPLLFTHPVLLLSCLNFEQELAVIRFAKAVLARLAKLELSL